MNLPAPLDEAPLSRRQALLAEPYEEPEKLRRPHPVENEPRVTERVSLPEYTRAASDPLPFVLPKQDARSGLDSFCDSAMRFLTFVFIVSAAACAAYSAGYDQGWHHGSFWI